jgi:hypothetical protein
MALESCLKMDLAHLLAEVSGSKANALLEDGFRTLLGSEASLFNREIEDLRSRTPYAVIGGAWQRSACGGGRKQPARADVPCWYASPPAGLRSEERPGTP